MHAGVLGTPLFMAPEQHLQGKDLQKLTTLHSQKIDVYAFGVLLLEFFSGVRVASLFDAKTLPQYYARRARISGIEDMRAFDSKGVDEKIPTELQPIINKCCAFDPAKRPNMKALHDELVEIHRFFYGGDAKSSAKSPGAAESNRSEGGALSQFEDRKSGGVSFCERRSRAPTPIPLENRSDTPIASSPLPRTGNLKRVPSGSNASVNPESVASSTRRRSTRIDGERNSDSKFITGGSAAPSIRGSVVGESVVGESVAATDVDEFLAQKKNTPRL